MGETGREAVRGPYEVVLVGSADFYPEERPVRRVTVDGFWMDDHPVTVAEFRRFVAATGHVTVAERSPDPAQYPGADPALPRPGPLVFHATAEPVDLRDVSRWWRYEPGAQWHHPQGQGSTVGGLDQHPFVTRSVAQALPACCTPRNPRVTPAEANLVPGEPGAHIPAGCSRASRTCARRSTACATVPRRGKGRRSTPPPATWASAASCGPAGLIRSRQFLL